MKNNDEWLEDETPNQIDHEQLIKDVKATLPTNESTETISAFFKILGDPTRAKIIYALYESELRVYDIVAILGLSQSSVSHQLRLLKQTKLVKNRKAGKEVYYSLADDHVMTIFKQVIEHINE
ncbi:ArsR/SmtB family transcription factor [Lapidilactobacillus mulanensis]|uniref:ArsR/SmtB family transcription factor n=1 Tax=Lapidilactobacillus mulanensis TaxID=2485999 RepID=A0ABW4DNN1_9LACO|nr:metalloregulator ArsR/SmtB family transcription factor [Lapidilactobacillus mulanensis]